MAGILTLTQLRSAEAADAPALKTMPGLSSSLTCLSRCTSCTLLVTPGVLPTAATRVRLSELMSELLPTLGSPITPAASQGIGLSISGDFRVYGMMLSFKASSHYFLGEQLACDLLPHVKQSDSQPWVLVLYECFIVGAWIWRRAASVQARGANTTREYMQAPQDVLIRHTATVRRKSPKPSCARLNRGSAGLARMTDLSVYQTDSVHQT